ncbi:glycosyltransferase family protein [Brevibacillus parabrevis]|uniref:glycosyltransferase family protein n=1 Tax=Brevibacillus parabrevis TaxID=54914 RepID=UPI0028D4E5BD|nr:glycosyltransferase family protein [Brevibacillus parabrevis]
MKKIAIIQARLGSTRLPSKVMLDLAGKTVLARVISRVRRIKGLDEVVIATSDRLEDDIIATEAGRLEVPVYRGSLENVLSRYYYAAKECKADVIMRVTSDCPLICPEISEKVLEHFHPETLDYSSNVQERTYPRGLDTEVFSFDALHRCFVEAETDSQKEHVTQYINDNPKDFRYDSVYDSSKDMSHLRWTLDTLEDYVLIRKMYDYVNDDTSYHEILDLVEKNPKWIEINRMIEQKVN